MMMTSENLYRYQLTTQQAHVRTGTAHSSSAVRAEPSLDIQLQVEKSFMHLHLNTTVITK